MFWLQSVIAKVITAENVGLKATLCVDVALWTKQEREVIQKNSNKRWVKNEWAI